jgi:hypothetical protein
MNHIASFVRATALAAVAFSVSAYAQQARGTASQQTTFAAPADFIEGNLKFHRAGGFLQVVDTAKNQSAGTVIFPPGGAPMFAPMPGYDIKAAYEKHMNGGGASAAIQTASAGKDDAPGASAVQSPAAAVPATGFDAVSKTVTLVDGRAVTFVDNDTLRVQMPGPAGAKTYALRFHKAGASGFMKEWAHREQGRVGGSLGGGGVTISLEAQNGMPGGEVYDTAKGTVYGSSSFAQAKSVTAVVREAVEVIKTSGQPDLAKLNVVKSLLSNNLGM